MCAGVAALAYPVGATVWNNHRQATLADQAVVTTSHVSPAEREAILAEAHRYNASGALGPILDPWVEHFRPNSKEWRRYTSQLGDADHPIASVVIPAIHVNLPVYHGTSDAVLAKGAGHLFGTSLPVGGEGTRAVITAHSGLASATMFDNLPTLTTGDLIVVRVQGESLGYRVRDTQVIEPTDISGLHPEAGQDLLTLVTCTPYGINTHRLLVTAQRVPLSEEDADAAEAVGPQLLQWWMLAPVVAITAGGVAVVLLRRRSSRTLTPSED